MSIRAWWLAYWNTWAAFALALAWGVTNPGKEPGWIVWLIVGAHCLIFNSLLDARRR